jgi:DNA/RNA endonuclease YhcR with UshA esterase domain
MHTRISLTVVAGILTAWLGAVAPVGAHHSFSAEYDGNKPITLKGTVTKMEWINPHAWIHLDVKNADGTVTSWMIEGAAPNALIRRGWNRNSLLPGTEISIEGYLAKDGSKMANGREMTLPDGKRLFAGSSGIGAPYEKEAAGKK